MASQATVLFNVGATKAGTSWLYRYLRAHPSCHLRTVKELHFFDAWDKDDCDWQTRRFRRLQAENGDVAGAAADYDELIDLLATDEMDTDAYLAYLNKGRSAQSVVADITPSYGMLTKERFQAMSKIAPDVRFIYILRDPVARLWSHVRMKAGRRRILDVPVQKWCNRIFWRLASGRKYHGILERGDYRMVLENLRNAVDPTKLLVIFYEDLFSEKTLARICEFLGIPPKTGKTDAPVNKSVEVTMNDDQLALAREWLADQYDYVCKHFGPVPDAWQANMVRVKA